MSRHVCRSVTNDHQSYSYQSLESQLERWELAAHSHIALKPFMANNDEKYLYVE